MSNWLKRRTSRDAVDDGLKGHAWRLNGAIDHSAFFRNLSQILSPDAVLVLEGGMHPEPLRAFLRKEELPAGKKLPTGTLWPAPSVYHLRALPAVLNQLSELTDQCAAPEVCDHLHAYRDDEILVQWFDAFTSPLYVSKQVAKEQVQQFAAVLGVTYMDETAQSR